MDMLWLARPGSHAGSNVFCLQETENSIQTIREIKGNLMTHERFDFKWGSVYKQCHQGSDFSPSVCSVSCIFDFIIRLNPWPWKLEVVSSQDQNDFVSHTMWFRLRALQCFHTISDVYPLPHWLPLGRMRPPVAWRMGCIHCIKPRVAYLFSWDVAKNGEMYIP